MKPSIKLILFILCFPVVVAAQQSSDVVDLKKHKVVIQFNDADSVSQVRAVLQVQNVKAAWPNAEVEVVCLAGGLDLLMTSNSKVSKAVADWSAKGVIFAACNNTMRMRKVKKEDLLSQAVVVPAAIVELSVKQEEGWSYFRGGK
jgi:uncharacterized protein